MSAKLKEVPVEVWIKVGGVLYLVGKGLASKIQGALSSTTRSDTERLMQVLERYAIRKARHGRS
jgi:hypothetical protein